MSRSTRKPWVKDDPCRRPRTSTKQYFNRRYRRVIRQDVRQSRNRYYPYESIFPGCAYCYYLDEYWDRDAEALFKRSCLTFELEPSYPLPHKFNDSYDVCDYRYYCDEPHYRRK